MSAGVRIYVFWGSLAAALCVAGAALSEGNAPLASVASSGSAAPSALPSGSAMPPVSAAPPSSSAPAPVAPAPAAAPRTARGVAPTDEALLRGLLTRVKAEGAELRRMERTAERQTRVMYHLAKADLENAKQMYCEAGDAVLAKFDAAATEEQNLQRMLTELLLQLPRARELGCLNHVANDEVYAVDVLASAIDEGQHAAFIAAGEQTVRDGKVVRFLAPPRHPESFHFEFRHATAPAAE